MRLVGSDAAGVEAKRATGGLPENLATTICAFANRPGGGIVLLGIDEATNFRSIEIDATTMAKQAANLTRQVLDPPPAVEIQIETLDGRQVVVVEVLELDPSSKPCRVRTGRHQGVWIRAFDGDYQASDIEIQALYSNRSAPVHDRAIPNGARLDDLDVEQVRRYLQARRDAAEPTSSARAMTDDQLLHAASVTIDGRPTIAGLLTLGVFPQRLHPGLHVRAVYRSSDPTYRALDAPRFEGTIPEMIAASVAWIRRMSPVAIRDMGDGRVVNEPKWPLNAVRELIANALLHRDLSWSVNEPVLVTLSQDELVVRNPGGLYGIKVGELGRRGVTPARNSALVSIATYITMPDGRQAVEQLASGIPTILRELHERHYPAPRFVDDAVRFTVICRSSTPSTRTLPPNALELLDELGVSAMRVEDLALRLDRSEQTIRRTLRSLAKSGHVEVNGGRGRPTTYQRRHSDWS